MEHSRLLERNAVSNLYLEYDNSLPVSYKKIQINNDGTTNELVPDTLEYNNLFWTSAVKMPNDDCYICLVVYRNNLIIDYIVVRCGVPNLKVFYTNVKYYNYIQGLLPTETVMYPVFEQYNKMGQLLESGNLIHLDYGICYFVPTNEFESLIKIHNWKLDNYNSSVLKLPYIKVDIGSGSGYSSNGLFVDTGFSNYGFIGEKYSYFDLNSGTWIVDSNKTAKAEDLAKAVAHKYGLEWDNRTSPTHVYNYIKYFRTYDEENKRFLLYAPAITPNTDINNFELIQEDELGNTFILGISMLLVQDLETVGDGSTGVYIPFK